MSVNILFVFLGITPYTDILFYQQFLNSMLAAVHCHPKEHILQERSVLKSARYEDFKTDLTFDIWQSRSWEN